MKPRIVLRRRDRGFDLWSNDHGHQLSTLSGMDAAELLFQMKAEMQSTAVGRDCLDRVAAMRRGEPANKTRRWPA